MPFLLAFYFFLSRTHVKYIDTILHFAEKLNSLVGQMDDAALDSCYRPGGWTRRQVIHHCADSHINSFIRFKLALTEDNPTIKPYKEELWAELSDSKHLSITSSLLILEGVHYRWAYLLESMNESDYLKTFFHPESQKTMRLDTTLAMYDWHCKHHLAHLML